LGVLFMTLGRKKKPKGPTVDLIKSFSAVFMKYFSKI
jgi:hypothetical protein